MTASTQADRLERVRLIQELRRSNVCQPLRNRKKYHRPAEKRWSS